MVCVQAHEMQRQLALQEQRLASEARMRDAMQQYAKRRLAMKSLAQDRPPSNAVAVDDEQALRELVTSGQAQQAAAMAKSALTNVPTAAADLVISSPVTPVADYEPNQTQSQERWYRQVQEAHRKAQNVQAHRQPVVALDEV